MKKYLDILVYGFASLVIIAIVLFSFGYGCRKVHRLCEHVIELRIERQHQEKYALRHELKCNISQNVLITHKPDAWYKKYHVIRHAGGGIDGKYYSGSLEAWDLSYERGNRVFDVDLSFTSDGVLVVRHEWFDNLEDDSLCAMAQSNINIDTNGQLRYYKPYYRMNIEEFKQTKPFQSYTPLTCEDMINYMAAHTDLYVALDMKDDLLSSYQYVVRQAREMDLESILQHVIVSVYDVELHDSIMAIYPFQNWVLRQHYIHERNYCELLYECLKYNIPVVNISSYYADDEGIQWLNNVGIYTFVTVCDYVSDMRNYQSKGFWGCVSNNLDESIFKIYE